MRLIDGDLIYKAIPAEEDNNTGMGMTFDEMDAYNDGIDAMYRLIQGAPTVEAIPKADYENRLKADLKAILVELQLEIEEMTPTYHNPDWSITDLVSISKVNKVIQQKINSLKEG